MKNKLEVHKKHKTEREALYLNILKLSHSKNC